ncbi:MAG: PEPxxWA-CTERM sorting domain-containing protein [Thermaurantiacus tibetensis]|uniref:PEPxxWA-CTERM sorting domain-containing protein n=1 Tax=Thermaurantiacus tibetensis TaxID=2759035 RepID=UPI00188EFD7F|nr:PEPxxWA-CTERM sorting domain-containing protein [Thermaurantiacus tibetensis]
MVRLAAALGAVALAAAVPASAFSFFDGFEGETTGPSILNYAGFANWTVSDGTVDLVRSGDFRIRCRTGNYCVDLDGSTSNAGKFRLNLPIVFAAGETVAVEFWLSGNQRNGATDAQQVWFDFAAPTNLASAVWTNGGVDTVYGPSPGVVAFGWNVSLPGTSPFLRYGVVFTPTEAGSATLWFDDWRAGNDNIGLILDDVSVRISGAVIPEPATWAMLIAGFGLVGVAARRRQRPALA